MSLFESFFRPKKPAVSTKEDPVLPPPVEEVSETAKAAEAQQEADEKAIEVIRARLNGELPASDDQEHIDIPLGQEEKKNEALEEKKNEVLENEQEKHRQLMNYIRALRELEETVEKGTPGELELEMSQPLLDGAFKQAAAAIKATNIHPDLTEREAMMRLIVGVRYKRLGELIAKGERMLEKSAQKIKELQGGKNTAAQHTREAWNRNK